MSQNFVLLIYEYKPNMPKLIITKEYFLQFLQTFIFLDGLLEQKQS